MRIYTIAKFTPEGDRTTVEAESNEQDVLVSLSIARGVVELCGGHIWVESEVGRGSTFTFTIPQQQSIDESGIANEDI